MRGLLFVSHKMTSAEAWELISSVQFIPSLNPFLLISLIKNIMHARPSYLMLYKVTVY